MGFNFRVSGPGATGDESHPTLAYNSDAAEYLVSWVPLGGYVKMASREEQEAMAALEGGELEEVFPPEKLFESKPLWARILTISAGVIMNVLFAWAVYAGLAFVYGRVEDPTTTVYRVEAEGLPEAAAALAELPPRSRIVRINGEEVASWGETRNRRRRAWLEMTPGIRSR